MVPNIALDTESDSPDEVRTQTVFMSPAISYKLLCAEREYQGPRKIHTHTYIS